MKRGAIVWMLLLCVGVAWLAGRAVRTGMGSRYVRAVQVDAEGRTDRVRYVAALPRESIEPGVMWSPARTAGVWLAALLTLATFSFLYGDNVLFKIAQSLVVGVAAGYAVAVGFWTVLVPNLLANLAPDAIRSWALPGLEGNRAPDVMYLVPLALSVLLLWRLSPRGGWIARWPLAFFIGWTAGLQLVTVFKADFVDQIRNTMLPLIVLGPGGLQWTVMLRNAVVLVGVLTALSYFFFSLEHQGALGGASRVGIAVLMITFGASFGMTVMGRIALLAARLQFLFDDWLWLIDPLGNRTGM